MGYCQKIVNKTVAGAICAVYWMNAHASLKNTVL